MIIKAAFYSLLVCATLVNVAVPQSSWATVDFFTVETGLKHDSKNQRIEGKIILLDRFDDRDGDSGSTYFQSIPPNTLQEYLQEYTSHHCLVQFGLNEASLEGYFDNLGAAEIFTSDECSIESSSVTFETANPVPAAAGLVIHFKKTIPLRIAPVTFRVVGVKFGSQSFILKDRGGGLPFPKAKIPLQGLELNRPIPAVSSFEMTGADTLSVDFQYNHGSVKTALIAIFAEKYFLGRVALPIALTENPRSEWKTFNQQASASSVITPETNESAIRRLKVNVGGMKLFPELMGYPIAEFKKTLLIVDDHYNFAIVRMGQ